MNTIRYQPKSLQRISEAVINNNVRYTNDISKLEIPESCKISLLGNYFYDNLWCDDKLPPISIEDYPYDHNEPYIRMSCDEYLSLQRYNTETPWFGYRNNHVTLHWYEIDCNNEPICYYCIHDVVKKPEMLERNVYRVRYCYTVDRRNLIDCLQGVENFCTICNTCTLFSIENWVWRTEHYRTSPVYEFIPRTQ